MQAEFAAPFVSWHYISFVRLFHDAAFLYSAQVAACTAHLDALLALSGARGKSL